MTKCLICDNPIPKGHKRYCSKKCRQKSYNIRFNDIFDVNLEDWEDVGFFIGYLRGLDFSKELFDNYL